MMFYTLQNRCLGKQFMDLNMFLSPLSTGFRWLLPSKVTVGRKNDTNINKNVFFLEKYKVIKKIDVLKCIVLRLYVSYGAHLKRKNMLNNAVLLGAESFLIRLYNCAKYVKYSNRAHFVFLTSSFVDKKTLCKTISCNSFLNIVFVVYCSRKYK